MRCLSTARSYGSALARPSWREAYTACKLLGRGPPLFRRTSDARPRPRARRPRPRTRDVPQEQAERAIDARRTQNAQVRRHEQPLRPRRAGARRHPGLGAFVLGPDKLASMAKDFGKVAGELKDVPKEFKEGLEEGEAAKAARVLESGEKEEGVGLGPVR